MRHGHTLPIIRDDRPSTSDGTKPSNNPTVYNRPPGIPSDGEGVRFSHLTLTAGSTDKPGLSRPAALKSWFCKRSKSMRTGTRCLSWGVAGRVARNGAENRTRGPAQTCHMSLPRAAIGIHLNLDRLAGPQVAKLRLLEVGRYPDVVE